MFVTTLKSEYILYITFMMLLAAHTHKSPMIKCNRLPNNSNTNGGKSVRFKASYNPYIFREENTD